MVNNPKIHPAADLFPMMSDEELQDLAADIKQNGQLYPIIMQDGVLIDGRNRLKACKIADVEPRFQDLNGHDPLAYIVSANLERRNLTKGQQAMLHALLYPEAGKGGRGKKSLETSEFSQQRLSQARAILHYSRALAEAVIKGVTKFDDALRTVKDHQQQSSSEQSKFARLQSEAPDLADRVEEDSLKLDEAMAILIDRERKLRELREAGENAAGDLPTFRAQVALIASAINSGHKISIRRDVMSGIEEAYKLLQKLYKENQ